MKEWYLYILLCADGTYYTGITTDTKRRLHEPNNTSRGAKYTRSRRPVQIRYRQGPYESRSDCQKMEHKIKKLCRQSKEDLIEGIRRDFRPEPKYPKVGDIVGDVDGDIGLVSDIYYSETE